VRRAFLLWWAILLAAHTPISSAEGQPLPVRKLTVKITEPADNDFVFGKARIAATVEASKDVRGVRVEFSVGGKLVFIDREAPYETFYDFGDEARSWVIEAVAISADSDEARGTIVTRKLSINYRESVDRVVVTASVVDDDKRFIEGLKKEDFRVSEDETAQEILDFSIETRPITMAILVDTSGSMREEIDQVQEAASSFVDTLRDVDKAIIIDFDENVYLLQDFTNDRALLRGAIEGTDAEGGTALYDAIFASYRKMEDIEGRKAIVLLTDGADTNSRFSYQKTLEFTRTHTAVIYSIGLGATVLDVGVRGSLKQVADETGGRAYFPHSASELAGVYQEIATDLRSQYYITYAPTNRATDGTWRKIKLECLVKGAKVKTRKGYYAVKK
jgi:VWFA-related protein